jgi:diaminohydroxyphosphoribosylaminopyrimidine deaminase/5-amino-6-(5-phosphoribosylamino)uracil reductase
MLIINREISGTFQRFLAKMSVDRDVALLRQACMLAQECFSVPSAYNVGAIIADAAGVVIATGFSRELPGNTHAEEVALRKALDTGAALRSATLYTSMEPCARRLSGKTPCVTLITESGIRRIVVGILEPDLFVPDACGVSALETLNIQVDMIMDEECHRLASSANVHLLSPEKPLSEESPLPKRNPICIIGETGDAHISPAFEGSPTGPCEIHSAC